MGLAPFQRPHPLVELSDRVQILSQPRLALRESSVVARSADFAAR